jgi:Ca2+-binding RTX toxin-like protein
MTSAGLAVTGTVGAHGGPRCFGKRATITAPSGPGPHTITGTEGDDVIIGSPGDDTIDGKGGNDRICGLEGTDTLSGDLGNDRVDGGTGTDLLVGDVFRVTGDAAGGGNDLLIGGDDGDLVFGDSYAINGDASGGGNDRLFGNAGNDAMHGDSGHGVAHTPPFDQGTADPGTASGGGRDLIDGGPDDGFEVLLGDSVSFNGNAAGAGDDVLLGGPGAEILFGDSDIGASADSVIVSGSGGDDRLDLGADGGIAVVGDHNTNQPGVTANGAGDDKIIGGSAGEFALIGDSAADVVTAAGDDNIDGRGGNDNLFGDNTNFEGTATVGTVGGEDRLKGGTGDDTLRAGPGDDRLNGGADFDDCDGEAGDGDKAKRCEVLAGIP